MYPGYSPADHEYGKAAQEYGKAAAEARAIGIELKHPDAEYEIGQGKGVKKKTLAGIREVLAAKAGTNSGGSGSGTGSGSEGDIKQKFNDHATTNGQASTQKNEEASSEGDNPYFVIDTKPTPVKISELSSQPLKRSGSFSEGGDAKKHKKAKKKHDGEIPKGEDTREVKTQDISEQVDERMKEKEKKRKKKEEKKRKRESEGEPVVATEESQPAAEPSATAADGEKPKKKKKKDKKSGEETLPDRTASKRQVEDGDGEAEDGEGKKKKKRKKSKQRTISSDA